MSTYRTCLLCHQADRTDNLVRYGTRANAHAKCFLERHGIAEFRRFSLHTLENFPVLALRGYVDSPLEWLGAEIQKRRDAIAARSRPQPVTPAEAP